jgi:hypothetical protein
MIAVDASFEEPQLRFADQRASVMALVTLLGLAPDLPAAGIALGMVAGAGYAQGVTVSLHWDPGAFEPWRIALGIDPATTVLTPISEETVTLTATSHEFGAPIELVAYVPHAREEQHRPSA